VMIASHSSGNRARMTSEVCNARYGASTQPAEAGTSEQKAALIEDIDVVLATAKAGIQVLSKVELNKAKRLLAAGDVNAVPPAGIEGVGVMDKGTPLAAGSGKAVGIGALAVGDVKYRVQRGLFEAMLDAQKPLYLDFRDAFALARSYVA